MRVDPHACNSILCLIEEFSNPIKWYQSQVQAVVFFFKILAKKILSRNCVLRTPLESSCSGDSENIFFRFFLPPEGPEKSS